MKSIIRMVCILVLLFTNLIRADRIQLKNGDRVSGKVVKKDGAVLTLQSELLGMIAIPWDAVLGLTSDELMTVVFPDGRSVEGTISVTDAQLQVVVYSGVKEAVAVSQVGALFAMPRNRRPGIVCSIPLFSPCGPDLLIWA